MKLETWQNADVHTHRYRDTHRDMLISQIFFYSIRSEYKAHLERIESHLPRLVCERDRDGASSASPTLGLDPATLSWVPLDTIFPKQPVPRNHRSQQPTCI